MAKKNFFSNLRITYNAPVTLTFALIAAVILLLDSRFLNHTLIPAFFTCPGAASEPAFDAGNLIDYCRLIFHIFGHSDWNHFLGNMAFILLLGPVIEERYGSPLLVLMMTITSLVTGVLNVCFSPSQLLGSSDIAFMLILLASFTTISKSEIPLSFILILILYIGREILDSGKNENISTLAHIAGGICGSMFAFLATPRPKTTKNSKTEKSEKSEKEEKSKTRTSYPRPAYGYGNTQNESKSRASERTENSGLKSKKTNSGDSNSDDTTVVGSIEL